MAIDWDAFDPFGELEPDEDYEYDEGYDVDRQIDEMKEEGNWPW
jgi:hypothetical protein|tara:strand:- start:9045 stop:9176 length:132 start_codon:yes stop_codon:yes gene_type:complete